MNVAENEKEMMRWSGSIQYLREERTEIYRGSQKRVNENMEIENIINEIHWAHIFLVPTHTRSRKIGKQNKTQIR